MNYGFNLGNLGGAEFLPLWAFFGFFCKIFSPEIVPKLHFCYSPSSTKKSHMNGSLFVFPKFDLSTLIVFLNTSIAYAVLEITL